MIVVYDTIEPIPNSVISRVLKILKSENLLFKFTTELKDLDRRTDVLILTSYRPKDLMAVLLASPNHLIFVQHGMQTSHSFKRDMASLISGVLGLFVGRKDAVVFNLKARIPYGISRCNVRKVNFSDKNAETVSFQANAKEVLLIDQPLYSQRLSKDYETLCKRYEVLVKWHPRSNKQIALKEWAGQPVSRVFGYSSSLMWGIHNVPVYSLLKRHEMPYTLKHCFDFSEIENDLGCRLNLGGIDNSMSELESTIKELTS